MKISNFHKCSSFILFFFLNGHIFFSGLDLRKAAFECMYTLLEKCIDRLDIFEFLSHVQDGLKDHYDIKVKI